MFAAPGRNGARDAPPGTISAMRYSGHPMMGLFPQPQRLVFFLTLDLNIAVTRTDTLLSNRSSQV